MFKVLKELYQKYKKNKYARVDLVMYAVMLLLIGLYIIITLLFD